MPAAPTIIHDDEYERFYPVRGVRIDIYLHRTVHIKNQMFKLLLFAYNSYNCVIPNNI